MKSFQGNKKVPRDQRKALTQWAKQHYDKLPRCVLPPHTVAHAFSKTQRRRLVLAGLSAGCTSRFAAKSLPVEGGVTAHAAHRIPVSVS